MLIITILLLGLNGCGYKADPFYTQDALVSDANVEFKIKKENNDIKE